MPDDHIAAWIGAHLSSSFFTSPALWLDECSRLLPLLDSGSGEIAALQTCIRTSHASDPALTAAYGTLFWGTDTSVFIPLWASACRENGSILADQTTLDCIHNYHRWGFTPNAVDGNPPDYIGEQFRFCAYLHACAAHACRAGTGEEKEFSAAHKKFTRLFLIPTLSAVCDGIARYCSTLVITCFADCMRMAVSGSMSFRLVPAYSHAVLDTLPFAHAWHNGRSAVIAGKGAAIVHTAGYNDCGGKCSLDAHVEEDCVLRFTKAEHLGNPHMRPCVRLGGYRHTYLHAGRLRYPLLRVGERGEGKFVRIGWDEAIDRLTAEWIRIRDAYGPASRFVLYGTGVTAMMPPKRLVQRLLNLDGGSLSAYNNYSDSCAEWGTVCTYGDPRSGNSPEDHVNSRLIILWGHNPRETIFGSERAHFLEEAKRNGTKFIAIDPRNSDSAQSYCDEWIGIVPATDSALADGMAYVIWTERLYDKEFMDRFCLGFDEEHMPPGIPSGESYESYLFGKKDGIAKTPEWASAITGVPASTITRLAREYATTKPASLLPGWGPQRTGNGEQTVRSLCLLACLTGNVGVPGGGAAGVGWVNRHAETIFPIGKNPFPGQIPTFLWAQAVDDAGALTPENGLQGVERLETGIKMLFVMASNMLVNQHSNINDTVRILSDESRCEYIVASDIFLTSSACFADLVLPAASGFETDNMGGPWSCGNYLLFNNRIRSPLFSSRFEWDWLREVAQRLGLRERFEDGKPEVDDWLKYMYGQIQGLEPELPPYEQFKQQGGYSYREKKLFIAYETQRNDPGNNPFSTASGKIEIFSTRLYEMDRPKDIPAIPKYVPCPEGPEDPLRARFPLQLIGWHGKRRCHSIHDNNMVMERLEPSRLWIHPDDAVVRGVKDGDEVEVFNDRGRLRIPAMVTDRIVRGVVAMPEGGWYSPGKNGTDEGRCMNVLTATHYATPAIRANPQHTNLVEVIHSKHSSPDGGNAG